MSGAEPCTLGIWSVVKNESSVREKTYGSPMTKVSPAFTEGTKPSDPTNAAAASLEVASQQSCSSKRVGMNPRENITIKIGSNKDVVDSNSC